MQGAQPVLSLRGLQVHAMKSRRSRYCSAGRCSLPHRISGQPLATAAVYGCTPIEGLALELTEDDKGAGKLYGRG